MNDGVIIDIDTWHWGFIYSGGASVGAGASAGGFIGGGYDKSITVTDGPVITQATGGHLGLVSAEVYTDEHGKTTGGGGTIGVDPGVGAYHSWNKAEIIDATSVIDDLEDEVKDLGRSIFNAFKSFWPDTDVLHRINGNEGNESGT